MISFDYARSLARRAAMFKPSCRLSPRGFGAHGALIVGANGELMLALILADKVLKELGLFILVILKRVFINAQVVHHHRCRHFKVFGEARIKEARSFQILASRQISNSL